MPTLYILKEGSQANPLFKNHWALIVHMRTSDTGGIVGDLIHVHGSVAAGFEFEARRNWADQLTKRPHRMFAVGEITASSLHYNPPVTEPKYHTDFEAKTDFERVLLRTPAPGPSLRNADKSSGGNTRVQLCDCQQWIRVALQNAVAAGYLTLNNEAASILSVNNQ